MFLNADIAVNLKRLKLIDMKIIWSDSPITLARMRANPRTLYVVEITAYAIPKYCANREAMMLEQNAIPITTRKWCCDKEESFMQHHDLNLFMDLWSQELAHLNEWIKSEEVLNPHYTELVIEKDFGIGWADLLKRAPSIYTFLVTSIQNTVLLS